MEFNGRRKIYTAAEEINAENVISEVNHALAFHIQNLCEEDYLYWYRRGKQPILYRTKEIRPEICNKVVVNNADMVVTFKNGYFLTKPAFYVSRKDDEGLTKKIGELNEILYSSGKTTADNEVINWFHTVGLAALFVEPNKDDTERTPVNVYALDPRSAFVVYSMHTGNKPMMGINMVIAEKEIFVDVFTESNVFRLYGVANLQTVRDDSNATATVNVIRSVEPNVVGVIPIIEYQYNENRMSAFETAIGLMDEINNVASNRIDGIEQFIQSLIVTTNVDFEDENITANKIRQVGMINLKSVGENRADFKVMSEQLDQTQTQVTLDDLYEQMLDKCGVPSSVRDSGSTSDNVGAVYLRSGWAMADTHARNCEDCFLKSNRQFDKVLIAILKKSNKMSIGLDDFELKIVRNDMNNLLVKSQAALNMKQLGFAPEICFERSGLSNDPLTDMELSKDYIEVVWQTKSDMEEANSTNLQGNFVAGYYRGDRGTGDHKQISAKEDKPKDKGEDNGTDD